MAILSREEIIQVDDRKLKEVPVPEWGGSVMIRSLTGRERDDFEQSTVKTNKRGQQEQNFENFRARFVALCVVDENGRRLFQSRQEVALLGNKSVAALQRIFNEAQEMNGMSQEDVDELTSDFEKAPDEDSTFD